MSKNILITGATGHLGWLVIDGLLKKVPVSNIFALVRDITKASNLTEKWITLRQGDYKDASSLRDATNGMDTIYLISSSDTSNRTTQHINLINAAKESWVKHIVYTSFDRSKEEGSAVQFITQAHIDTEKYLKESGISYTILRHGIYMDTLPDFLGPVPQTGVVYFPAWNTKVAFTARKDLADGAVNILMWAWHENKVYNFTNSESYNFSDIANIFTSLLWKQIPYIDPTVEDFKKTLTENNVPEMYIDLGIAFATAMKDGDFINVDTTLEDLLWRKPMDMKYFLKEAYKL